MYYVYILISKKDNSKYIGCTNDIRRRIGEHNRGEVRYTKAHKPYKLKWCCCFVNRDKALEFEKYLKSSSGHAFLNKRLI